MVIYGLAKVGKTQIINSILNRQFEEGYTETIGVEFANLFVKRASGNQSLRVWDVGGNKRYV